MIPALRQAQGERVVLGRIISASGVAAGIRLAFRVEAELARCRYNTDITRGEANPGRPSRGDTRGGCGDGAWSEGSGGTAFARGGGGRGVSGRRRAQGFWIPACAGMRVGVGGCPAPHIARPSGFPRLRGDRLCLRRNDGRSLLLRQAQGKRRGCGRPGGRSTPSHPASAMLYCLRQKERGIGPEATWTTSKSKPSSTISGPTRRIPVHPTSRLLSSQGASTS